MTHLAVDTENTTFEIGNPFYAANRCCVVSFAGGGNVGVVDLEYSGTPYRDRLDTLRSRIADASLIIGFNLKYDLHWLRRYGIQLRPDQRIWDCQLFEYLVSAQHRRLESLEAAVDRYALGKKEKGINEYWDLGVDTDKIPYDVLSSRALSDSVLTEKLGLHQMRLLRDMPRAFQRLVHLSNYDLLTLQEMEWNGIMFDFQGMRIQQKEVTYRLQTLDAELNGYFPGLTLNWNSTVDRSAALYGGSVTQTQQELIGTYKTGQHAGQPKYRRNAVVHVLERLVEPLAGSQLAGGSVCDDGDVLVQHQEAQSADRDAADGGAATRWSTDKATLPRLKAKGVAKALVELLQERQRLEKLNGTYFEGLQDRAALMGWDDGVIHGNFNQTTVITGRLASSRPNLQNFPEDIDQFMCTRYPGDLYRTRTEETP